MTGPGHHANGVVVTLLFLVLALAIVVGGAAVLGFLFVTNFMTVVVLALVLIVTGLLHWIRKRRKAGPERW